MKFVFNDGGRKAAGFKGNAGDCATRAIAIATGLDYRAVYDGLNTAARAERPRGGRSRSSARTGVHTRTAKAFLEAAGWEWFPTMTIGSGCTVHLRSDELPPGRLVVRVSKHFVAVVNGVVHDTHDSTRDGDRCVYGYFRRKGEGAELEQAVEAATTLCRCGHLQNRHPNGGPCMAYAASPRECACDRFVAGEL